MFQTRVRAKRSLIALWDLAAWFVATFVLAAARYDFSLTSVQWTAVLLYPVVAGALHVIAGWFLKLYSGHSRIGSFQEASSLLVLVLAVGLVTGIVFMAFVHEFPRGVGITVPLGALSIIAVGRLLVRARLTRQHHLSKTAPAHERVLIYGAGNAGRQVGQLLLFDPDAPYSVVGYIDDDPEFRNLHLAAGRVIGTRKDLTRFASELDVRTVLLAIPSAPTSFLRGLVDELEAAGIKLLVLPTLHNLPSGQIALAQVHEVEVADLVGQSQACRYRGSAPRAGAVRCCGVTRCDPVRTAGRCVRCDGCGVLQWQQDHDHLWWRRPAD